VHVASDANSARALARTTEFEILLSDLGLPDGNGWDLLRELRNGHQFKAIAMSGYNSDADLERSKEAGFAEHLPKPLTPDDLDAAFDRVMSGADR
jgi:CheY-like chemotaxis protein